MDTNELIALRREFHHYAEAGWTEFRTTVRILEVLQNRNIPVRWGKNIHHAAAMYGLPAPDVLDFCFHRALEETGRPDLLFPMEGGFTGCIAEIQGAHPGPVIGIRVDIDCCEVFEAMDNTHLPAREGFASCHTNCMHACGHDAHAAIGIGTAVRLWEQRDRLHGTVRVIFQPAEEGLRGAASMTAAGVVDNCDLLFGLHVGIHDLPFGTVAASCTNFFSSTKFDVIFHGVSAHAGIAPEQGRNAMAAGAKAVLDLLDIPSHHEGVCRVNVGTFTAGSGRNIIPAQAHLTVETRGETAQLNDIVEQEALSCCRAAASAYGCTLETQFMGGATDINCDEVLVRQTVEILETIPLVNQVLPAVSFGAGEDITTMMRALQHQGGQATELLLGMPLVAPHHNSRFDIVEEVIPLGVEILTVLAMYHN